MTETPCGSLVRPSPATPWGAAIESPVLIADIHLHEPTSIGYATQLTRAVSRPPSLKLLSCVHCYVLVISYNYHLVDVGIAVFAVGEACGQAQVLKFGMPNLGLGFLYINRAVNELEVLEQWVRAGQGFYVKRIARHDYHFGGLGR